MGSVYSRLGEVDKAVEMYKQAVSLSPKDVPAVFAANLSAAHFAQGDCRACIDWNLRALQSDPKFWRAHVGLAMAYAMVGDDSRARAEVAGGAQGKPGIQARRREIARVCRHACAQGSPRGQGEYPRTAGPA